MALIKCSECNHDVSDQAARCPMCGYPIESAKDGAPVASPVQAELIVRTIECVLARMGYWRQGPVYFGVLGDNIDIDAARVIFRALPVHLPDGKAIARPRIQQNIG